MADLQEIKELSARLIALCYNAHKNVFVGMKITCEVVFTGDGEPIGSWEILIEPTKAPEGKKILTPEEIEALPELEAFDD